MPIILKNGQRLQLYSDSNQAIQVMASYADFTGTNTSGSLQAARFTGPGTFDIVSSPGTDAIRQIKHLNIRNIGSGSTSVTASHSSSNGLYTTYSALLASSSSIEWQDNSGWTKLKKDGTKELIQWRTNFVQVVTYSTSGTYTWTKPTNPSPDFVYVMAWGGGGGGGGGGAAANGGQGIGGTGGGGGGHERGLFYADDLPSTVTITVGSGGSGMLNRYGNGAPGGDSSFGSYLKAYGGGQGTAGGGFTHGTFQTFGGGGGGSGERGYAGTGNGGGPGALGTAVMGGKGGSGNTTMTPGHAEFGGGGGGSSSGTSVCSGSKSIWGGGGGGSGSSRNDVVMYTGSAGAFPDGKLSTHGGGGAPGTGSIAGSYGPKGQDGREPIGLFGGVGGGGGGSIYVTPSWGGDGGKGSRRGGGGGGGGLGVSTNGGNGGFGGDGGPGEIIVISW